MGIAVRIVSTVLKSAVGDKFGCGLAKEIADISIDGISQKGISEIADFIDKEKSEIDRVLSKDNMKAINIPEEHIDYIVVEIKDLLSKITITDDVFRQCKYDSMKLKDFMWDVYDRNRNRYIENENEIKTGLFSVADTLTRVMCESEDFNNKMLIQISNSNDDVNIVVQELSKYMNNNFDKISADIQTILEILKIMLEQNQKDNLKNSINQKVKSRTQEYADKWNANMFLNDFDKRDQNAGANVKLSEVYLEEHLPNYLWGDNINVSDDLKELISEYVYNHGENKMLLILGQPGIGKSTLITWIIANFEDKKNDILVYKFASDLKNIDWHKSKISWKILDELNLTYDDLNGKTVILDGFDEVNIGDNRRNIIENLYSDLIYGQQIKNFSLIVTCRENYIQGFERMKCQYITLQEWDKNQIRSFCNVFKEKTKATISEYTIYYIIENKEILGIPLILYMTLALNIPIEHSSSIVDVYDKIFALEGGIYERCIENKNFSDEHRIAGIKKQIHQISKEIAIWMFENNSEGASILYDKYEKICERVLKENENDDTGIKQDVKIGSYFKSVRHCEGLETDELCFVHRSIYEYFVAETMYRAVENSLMDLSEESQMEFAGNIAIYLKEGDIPYSIGEYLKYKILILYNKLENRKKHCFLKWWESTLKLMLEKGMFYFVKGGIEGFENILIKELKCFRNIMYISSLLVDIYPKDKYILENTKTFYLQMYLRLIDIPFPYVVYGIKPSQFVLHKVYLQNANLIHVRCISVDFNGADMREIDLRESDLSKSSLKNVNLRDAKLSRADLSRVKLNMADLQGAILSEVNLRGAILIKADLRKTNLQGAYLRKADLSRANLREANLQKTNLNRANFKDANLNGADLSYADLRGANLDGTKLNGVNLTHTIWRENDIKNISSRLEKAYFDYLIIENKEKQRKVYRSDLFPEKSDL